MPLSKRYKVNCYLWDRTRDYVPGFRKDNVQYYPCTVKGSYYNLYTLWKLLFFELWLFWKLISAKVHCIHAVDLDTGIVGMVVARLKKIHFVYQCLDPYYANLPSGWPKIFGKWTKRMENYVISSADLFIVTDLLRMPQHSGAVPRRILEFPNVPFLDMPESQERAGGELTVGYLGSLIEGRNLLTIIDAVGELAGEGIRLIIGGFGPLEKEVEERAGRYGNISFFGWIPYSDVLKMENGFDILVHTTDPEHESQKWVSPAKLFESMALGKPIVVSENTLAAERVRLAGCGIAVGYGSKSDLQRVFMKFRNNLALVRELGEKGKEEYSHAWSWGMMEQKLLDAYENTQRAEIDA